jgi:FkbM family methyltransferase
MTVFVNFKLRLKSFIVRLLSGDRIFGLICCLFPKTIPSSTYPGLKINNSSKLRKAIKSQFFFGFYESCELRFINKYLMPHENVVELGSSIGVISSFVSLKKSPKKLVLVEANSDLIDEIKGNLKLNNVPKYTLINKGLGDGLNNSLWFIAGASNTTGKVSEEWKAGAIRIDCVELHHLVSENNLDDFVLICDIEGAEVFVLRNAENLRNCKMLIIELHTTYVDGRRVSVNDLEQAIWERGFRLIDKYGPIIVAEKISNGTGH